VVEQLQRLKWFLWHGSVFRALHTIDDLTFDLKEERAAVKYAKLAKAVRAFGGYVAPTPAASRTTRTAASPGRSSPPRSSSPQ
jgi:hypothetical protein